MPPQGSIETEYFTEDVEYVAGAILNIGLVHMSARWKFKKFNPG